MIAMEFSAISLEPVGRCPLCKVSERSLFEREAIPPKEIQLMRCDECDFIYTSAVVRADHIPRLYQAYNVTRDFERPDMREKRTLMYEIDGAYVRRFLGANDERLLDIGSGAGDFIAQFRGDFELHCVEADAAARAACVRACSSLLPYPDLKTIPHDIVFDAIVFRGTLQYMPDLHGVAAWCSDHLPAGGHLFVLATPNAESILAQLQRERWVLANKLEHRYWFTRRHLVQLFGDRFHLIACDFPYLGTPYENYSHDLRKVLAMIESPKARLEGVPFFGSMMNLVLEKI
jgi:SAM-dependent methyltransferase